MARARPPGLRRYASAYMIMVFDAIRFPGCKSIHFFCDLVAQYRPARRANGLGINIAPRFDTAPPDRWFSVWRESAAAPSTTSGGDDRLWGIRGPLSTDLMEGSGYFALLVARLVMMRSGAPCHFCGVGGAKPNLDIPRRARPAPNLLIPSGSERGRPDATRPTGGRAENDG